MFPVLISDLRLTHLWNLRPISEHGSNNAPRILMFVQPPLIPAAHYMVLTEPVKRRSLDDKQH